MKRPLNSKKSRVTAEELLRQREENPVHAAQMRELEMQKAAAVAEYKEAAMPLLAALLSSGFEVESLEALGKSEAYKNAVPILVKWLPEISNNRVKESIVRALSQKCAGLGVVPALLTEFRATPEIANASLKWTIGNALEALANDEFFYDIVELVQDKHHGIARQMLAASLGKMKNPKAVDVLIGLLDDEEVVGHALAGLKKLKAKQARAHIERFINHPKAWVRKEAREALNKIGNSY